MANTQREIEQRAKALFERCVALDLAANVTDDAAKPRAQKLQFPPGAVELVGMRVAPHHDGGTLGQAQIALAQLNALALGQLHQLRDRAMGEPGVGRMRDRLLLYSGIYRNPFEIFGVDRPGAVGPPRGSPATARRSAPHPAAGASALATSAQMAARDGTQRPHRSTGNTGSPPIARTAPRRRGCAYA